MKIGLDLDTTLVDLPVVDRISKELGLNYKDSDPHAWDFSPFPPQYLERAKQLFKDPSFMCELIPYPGTKNKIKEWAKDGHELILITARSPLVHNGTRKMVNKHFPEIKTIDFVDTGESKKNLFIKYKLDRWIDDAPHEIIHALDLGIRTFMVCNEVTPYNFAFAQECKDSKLSVVRSVSEIQYL